MGTLVTFRPRPEDAQAKTEAILTKIGELYQQKMKAKEDLPFVLSELITHGEQDFAIQALMRWGSGEMEPHQVLTMCQEYAAAAGIRSVANQPF